MPLSDFHLGDPLFDEEKLQGYMNWILENDNCYTFINGDIFDTAIEGSLGNTYEASMNVRDAKIYAKKLLKPLVNRILGINAGNHENRIFKKTGNDISLDMAMYLGLEDVYDRISLVGDITINDKVTYTFYIKHGRGGGKTQAFKMRKLKEMCLIVPNADLFMISHVHDMLTFQIKPQYIDPDVHELVDHKQTFVSSSSFLKFGGYADEGNYEPAKTGSPRIRLNAERKDIHVSI
jgi:hypothetical protein